MLLSGSRENFGGVFLLFFGYTPSRLVVKTCIWRIVGMLMQMIAVGIINMLPIGVQEAIMSLCFFFNAIGQKVLDPEALAELKKRHFETLCLLEMYFLPSFSISWSISLLTL